MSTFCPNRNSNQYKELYDIFGSSEIAHLLWNRNGGHPLDLDPSGESSSLFQQLLKLTDNDRFEAIRLKAQFYLSEYTDVFGKWYEDFKHEPSIEDPFEADVDEIQAGTDLLNRMANKLGYEWRFATEEDELDPWGATFDLYGPKPVVLVNPNSFATAGILHEYGHLFINHIKRDNKPLYDSLVEEYKKMPEAFRYGLEKELREGYKGYTDVAIEDEIITLLLEKYANQTVDKETGLFNVLDKTWEYIKKFIADLFGITDISKLSPKTTLKQLAYMITDPNIKLELGEVFTSGKFLESYSGTKDTTGYVPYKKSVSLTSDEIKSKFKEHSKNIIKKQIEENGKTKEKRFWHIDDNTEQPLKGVRRLMAEHGYDTMRDVDENIFPIRRGKAIHGHLQNIADDIIEDISGKYKVTLSQTAKKDLEKIFKQLKGKYTALTEVEIADPDTGIVGIIDLMLIGDDGKIRIYDFKTKTRGIVNGELRYDPFDYYTSTRNKRYSDKEKDHLQISIYAHMIQKLFGIPVASIGIVKLNAITKGKMVESSIKGIKEQFKEDSDSKGYNYIESIQVHSEDENDIATNYFNDKGQILLHNATTRIYEGDQAYIHSKLLENQAKYDRDIEEDVFIRVNKSESEAGLLLNKLKQELAARIRLARRRYTLDQRENLENLGKTLEEDQSTTTSLYNIIIYAADEIRELNEEYEKYMNDKKPFTPGLLYKWKDAVQSYKSLQDLRNLLNTSPDIIPNNDYVMMLNRIIEKVNFYEGLYKTEGRYLIAKWLTPYYNGIKVKYEDLLKSEYRKLKHREVKKGNKSLGQFEEEHGTIEEYVEGKYRSLKRNVENETFKLLYKELEIASRDIGELTRWLDNMLDSSDPVASAMVSAFMEAEEKSRLEAIDMKYDITEALEALQKHHNKKAFNSEESFYSFMLELDENRQPTQYLLRPYRSIFWEDVEKFKKEAKAKGNITKEELNIAVSNFKSLNREFNSDLFREGVIDYVVDLAKNKEISIEEFNILKEVLEISSIAKIDYLSTLEGISERTASLLTFWKSKNIGLFYNYSNEYINKDWDKFMNLCGIDTKLPLYLQVKELKKSTNPYAVFYNKIDDIASKANKMIPNGYHLHDRLPGVVKLNNERIKAGQNPFTIAKNTMDTELFVRPEDVERGNKELTNEFGRIKYFIPINYTAKIELENQSFDLAGIYFKFWESANEYRNKRNILPELEMTRYFINERRALQRSVFKDILKKNGNVDDDPEPVYKDTTTLAEMLNDWFEMAVYGKYTKDEKALVRLSDKKSIDLMKGVDLLNRYTSLNLLGGNVVQGFANVLIGEIMQTIEVIAHEYVSAKSYTRAATLYSGYLPQVMGDVSRNVPKSLPGLLYQEFDVLGDDITETMFTTNTAAGRFLKSTSIYFVQHAGEHWLQNRFLLAMLLEKKAYDKQGNLLGNMLDQYEIKDGKLSLKENVSLEKSQWTAKDQQAFKQKIKGVLSRMHGEYGDMGRVAIQRTALGRMAYMFRKFVVPGFRRRWGSQVYMERLGQYVEGNYVTTARFFRNYWRDLVGFKFALMSENWAGLSDHEKANILRTLSEATFVIAAIILASALTKAGADDDEEWLTSFLAYQSYRLRAELLFFTPKIDEAWSILRSPMASMAVLQNLIDLSNQLTQPTELYERGPFKGQLKLKKIMLDFVPIYKQIYKARDIEQQISWFKND